MNPELAPQMRIAINSAEAFLHNGSGIKYFSRSLIDSLRQKDLAVDILLEGNLSNNNGSELSSSSLFKLYDKISPVEKLKLRLKTDLYSLPLFRLCRSRLHRVSPNDPLLSLAQARIPGKEILNPVQFLIAKQVFRLAKDRFSRKASCTRIAIPSAGDKSIAITTSGSSIFHNPFPFPLIASNCSNVTTIHDLIPLTHPELCLDHPDVFYRLLNQLISASSAVHAISRYTADQLLNIYGSAVSEKLRVIPQPVPIAASTSTNDDEYILEREHLYNRLRGGEDVFVIQVGSIEPKKNHSVSIAAFNEVRSKYPNLKLVVIGKNGWLSNSLCDYMLASKPDGIEWIGSASRGVLESYMKRSLALLFPSLVEGWGLPPLEAMAMGCPVITSSIPPCRESCGNAALFIEDPTSVNELRDHLLDLLGSVELGLDLCRRGRSRAREFSVSRFSESMLNLYQSIDRS
ncbi:glycosyltransferase family 4 protein [Synechococcus sp. J7-Johnson]|uniref:glycosyltransferase family 4 protein n=1 Tax=Synechococcus sp. J7-Johnson TaxID=2823737 RepID=UPI0020CD3950|nr:glycosyltransferase family 1 protein [Synechococcus sp. J7-Johnson]MCP9839914.1 glycosyltransferase family 4 protein [Synechococcus sp. J7-Johnson]